MVRYHAGLAWIGPGPAGDSIQESVLLEVEEGRFVAVTPDTPPSGDAIRLRGLTIPGLVNAHSHAFHRALRGRTQSGAGDFWAWRERMYDVAGRLDPDSYLDLARATYAEMALAGITTVGEFHYLHHGPGGRPYGDSNAMGRALIEAARQAGIRITLLDTCYLRGGFDGRAVEGPQLRFTDGSVSAWAERAGDLAPGPGARIGAAIHSVRALSPPAMAEIAGIAAARRWPLHFHLSEQPAENADCLAATGQTPAGLLEQSGALTPAATAVHATHLTAGDLALLGSRSVGACLCPTTERDLADGVGPAQALAEAGCRLSLGSDSQAFIDLFEEARAVELDQRLISGRRGLHPPAALLAAATAGGAAALGWEAGLIAPGRLADLVTLDLDSPRLAGAADDLDSMLAAILYAAAPGDVAEVIVGGTAVVSGGRHLGVDRVPGALQGALRRLDAKPG